MEDALDWLANSRRRELVDSLADKEEREAFVRWRIERGLASQIYALRSAGRLTQAQLADALGKPQSVISRLESVRYSSHSLRTLLDVASHFDVALVVAFAPFSELVDRTVATRVLAEAVPSWSSDEHLHAPRESSREGA